jgi:hypothetical protein
MIIATSKTPPSTFTLKDILKPELRGNYDYTFFGLENEKSLIVSKSPFVGVQIFKKDNELLIQGAPPTLAGGIASFYFLC